MTRISEGTPERFFAERCRSAQSSGEWPGDKSTLFLAFGVFSVSPAAVGGGPRLPFETTWPRFGTGPRFGRGPFEGTCIDWEDLGRARRLEGTIRGGGAMSEEDAGLEGGAMSVEDTGLEGGAMSVTGRFWALKAGATDVLCAEFIAGNEGGGRLSSSSSSELSCSARVKVGIAGPLWASLGTALGVDCGDRLSLEGTGVSSFVWA